MYYKRSFNFFYKSASLRLKKVKIKEKNLLLKELSHFLVYYLSL